MMKKHYQINSLSDDLMRTLGLIQGDEFKENSNKPLAVTIIKILISIQSWKRKLC